MKFGDVIQIYGVLYSTPVLTLAASSCTGATLLVSSCRDQLSIQTRYTDSASKYAPFFEKIRQPSLIDTGICLLCFIWGDGFGRDPFRLRANDE